MENFFDGFEVRYVPCLDNYDGDYLAWISSSRAPTSSYVIIEKLSKPSVKPAKAGNEAIEQYLMVIDESQQESMYDWINLIKMFQAVPYDRWDIILTRCQWDDDEVYLQRRRHSIALGHSQ
jgi:hypothetical protein